jgi:hypothetical protein
MRAKFPIPTGRPGLDDRLLPFPEDSLARFGRAF